MSRMANFWAADGLDVTIITLDELANDFYPLDRRVRRVALDLAAVSATPITAVINNLVRLWRLRAEILRHDPHVVISFMDYMNVLTLLATLGLPVSVIVSERNDPRFHFLGDIWSRLRSRLYRRAKALVVQSTAVKQWAQVIAPPALVHVIPNPVSAAAGCDDHEAVPIAGPFVVAMARLVHQKGLDLLIEAFARCTQTRGEWSLVIIGEGEERERLSEHAARLGLTGRVLMPGRLQAPATVLRKASLFVLSSRHEGFPNALLEAMCCGLPVISFDCPSGPAEIIHDGVDGVLVPPENVAALANAMGRLMDDERERQYLGEQATRVVERFSLDKVMSQWEQVIDQAMN